MQKNMTRLCFAVNCNINSSTRVTFTSKFQMIRHFDKSLTFRLKVHYRRVVLFRFDVISF